MFEGNIAEVAGFMGWLGAIGSDGDVFQLSNVFWVHELSRLHVWLPVFVILSGLRFGIVYFDYRARPQIP